MATDSLVRLEEAMTSIRRLLTVGCALALSTVGAVALNGTAQAATKAYYMPFPNGVSYRVTQGWDGSASHAGSEYTRYAVDFGMSSGSTVVASAPGTVYDSYYSPNSWGETVVIKHPWGECTRYSHLSQRILTSVGATVQQGQVVGKSGATGHVTGPHLDFKVENCASRESMKWAFADYSGSLYDTAVLGKTLTSRNKPGGNDGTDTVGMWDPDDHSFHLAGTNASGASRWAFQYGAQGDLPVTGDWDGNGKDSVGIYRPGKHEFHLSNGLAGGASDYAFAYGTDGDVPVVGDWDGNGTTTIGVYRGGVHSFFLRNANNGGDANIQFESGKAGQTPLSGDWDGE
jgi:hypothetical protein